MPCLENIQQEIMAGKLAGQIYCTENPGKKYDLITNIPENLRKRVNEILRDLFEADIHKIAKEIAALKTREERIQALEKVHYLMKTPVRDQVIEIFNENRGVRNASEKGEER